MSISSASATVTAAGGAASSSSRPPGAQMWVMEEVRPEGSTTTSSPTFMIPPATVPANERWSSPSERCGRSTYWTGKRTSVRLRSEAMCTLSRCWSSAGPVYQGIRSTAPGPSGTRPTTLSPRSADSGMNATSWTSSLAANAVKSRTMASKVAWS